MEKLQILFPEPQLRSLRQIAKSQDRPVSELVRAAVEAWLIRHDPWTDGVREDPPVYSAGEVLINADQLRDVAYDD